MFYNFILLLNEMEKKMEENKFDIGMIGLGVMGRNFVLNMADKGFGVIGFDTDTEKVSALENEGKGKKVHGAKTLEEFINGLKKPRAVMMLVPAGKAVDSVIDELVPVLDKGDLIIDGGNSHYTDTNRHAKYLEEKGIHFLGTGISGGEEGARRGPSMMPGGPKEAYKVVQPIFEAAAAKVNDEPCVTYLGPGSAGHYVKMVHNGIEYGLMQLISETYDLMKNGLRIGNEELYDIYKEWNESELQSFLMDITYQIFKKKDDKSDNMLIDMILDAAKQKGTGKWTSQDAMDLQVPLSIIDTAVAIRDLSAYKKEREKASKILTGPVAKFEGNNQDFVAKLKSALYFAVLATYSQGMAMLKKASDEYNYNIELKSVAKIWRGGCIIRAALLEDIYEAFDKVPELPNLMLDPKFSNELINRQNDLREVVKHAASIGIAAPGLMSALSYYDGYRNGRMPANLLQAQRDFFGAHTYQRIDEEGTFHSQWD